MLIWRLLANVIDVGLRALWPEPASLINVEALTESTAEPDVLTVGLAGRSEIDVTPTN